MVKVGLINNRHPMPVQNYIFEKEIENVFDFESIKNEIKEFILEKVDVHTVLNHVCLKMSLILFSIRKKTMRKNTL